MRGAMNKASHHHHLVAIIAAGLFALLLCVIASRRPFPEAKDIRSDGVGYHAWVHALAQGDFSFCRYESLLGPVDAISKRSEDGQRCQNKYPPGVGLLQFPFSRLLMADKPEVTGFSPAEQHAVLWIGALLLFTTAVMMYFVLIRRGLVSWVAVLSVAALMFGTGLFHYGTYDASFSHVYSAFGVTLLMWLAMDRPRLGVGRLATIAVVAGWLYLVRQTNAALSLGVLYIALAPAPWIERTRGGVAWLVGTMASTVALLAYGRYVNGQASLSNYGSEGFPTLAGHAAEVLVSYERGLFSYYPVVFVACVLALVRIRRPASHAFLILVGIFTLLYGSWHVWHLGGGFGHRGFIELAPFGMLVVAEGLSSLRAGWRISVIAAMGVCCLGTLFAMIAYWHGELPIRGTVGSVYWRTITPISMFVPSPYRYTEDEVRHIKMRYVELLALPEGKWGAKLIVTNTNAVTPLRGIEGPYPPLRVSWRVVSPGTDIRRGWENRADIPALAPGQSSQVIVPVLPLSPSAGRTELQFTIVQETVFWAHDIGVAPLAVPWDAAYSDSSRKTD